MNLTHDIITRIEKKMRFLDLCDSVGDEASADYYADEVANEIALLRVHEEYLHE